MSDSDVTPLPGNTEAKLLLLMFFAAVGWLPIVFMLDQLTVAAIPTAYALPLHLGLSLFFAVRLARKGTSPIPVAIATIGILYIVGGGTFDMVATVIHTPTLRDEANEIGRVLLDSGHPLAFVYGYAIIAQSLLLALICSLWIALLRHRGILIASINSKTFVHFFKDATGGAHLTWRQWFIPFKMSELPRAYHILWFVVALFVAGMVDRWYLGLEWFNLVRSMRSVCFGGALSVGLTVYFTWLWIATRPTKHAIQHDGQSELGSSEE